MELPTKHNDILGAVSLFETTNHFGTLAWFHQDGLCHIQWGSTFESLIILSSCKGFTEC
jgi:hypothetical protein